MAGMSFSCAAASSPVHSVKGKACRWRRHISACHLTANSHPFKSLHGCFASPSSLQDHQVHSEADYSAGKIEELKIRVGFTLRTDIHSTRSMVLVDTIQRLGISHQFEDELELILDRNPSAAQGDEDDLFSTTLRFRLLRQRGYNVDTDVFHEFMDRKGHFKESLSKDLAGLLSLHEASYLGVRDEEVLSQAMGFSEEHLRRSMLNLRPVRAREVNLALEFPRQRRMVRSEARSYIGKYAQESGRISDVLQLATLDFNLVQSQLRIEIAVLRSWWKELGLAEKLSFARDRPLECFLWTVGLFPEPRFSQCRIEIAKTIAILLVIDDVYDIQGSLDELILFTDAVRRSWGVEAMEDLPEYMKICYMALYNTTNEIGYRVLKEHGRCIIRELRKTWVDLCEGFLVEARWFSGGVVPEMEEYVGNGVSTAGTYMAFVHAFYLIGSGVNKQSSDVVNSCPKLFTSAGRILRLWDDLGTAKVEQERGDVASSIDCYMKEGDGASEAESRLHVRSLIHSSWLDLNGEALAATSLPRSTVDAALNLARAAQAMYQHGDDGRLPSVDQHIHWLLMEPIPEDNHISEEARVGRTSEFTVHE
ncbi:unnamed protein product [Musa acuminata subsp. malaccensis]|uniref:(wild Malaysian banana) hypothetical protein n=1 Tax=Musa acuminata subsp. malaccensis TaxID=214687 RepID=A0A8D7FR34_MUSAM|nr:unnamed protein product [Musa acuminata subsp. malaccensis]